MLLLTERYPEKFGRKLIGRTDIEDALKRLDKLTHEEVWMVIAQNLRTAHNVAVFNNRVASMDHSVGVDTTVKDVRTMVVGVDKRARAGEDREVIHGA